MWEIEKYVLEMTSIFIKFMPFSYKSFAGSRVRRRERGAHVEIKIDTENSTIS
jgi:hypothetical protein